MSNWRVQFKSVENISTEIAAIASSIDWILNAACALTAIALFILAGNRAARGDYPGSIMSIVGACIVAIAPIVSGVFTH